MYSLMSDNDYICFYIKICSKNYKCLNGYYKQIGLYNGRTPIFKKYDDNIYLYNYYYVRNNPHIKKLHKINIYEGWVFSYSPLNIPEKKRNLYDIYTSEYFIYAQLYNVDNWILYNKKSYNFDPYNKPIKKWLNTKWSNTKYNVPNNSVLIELLTKKELENYAAIIIQKNFKCIKPRRILKNHYKYKFGSHGYFESKTNFNNKLEKYFYYFKQ